MVLKDFLRWISFTDLENLNHQTAITMVKETIDALAQDSAGEAKYAHRDLEPIYQHLRDGGIPTAALSAYYEKYAHLLQQKTVASGTALEKELRKLASDLDEEEWCTHAYLAFERGVEAFENGDSAPLSKVIKDMELTLEQAWEPYYQAPIMDYEIKAESVVGHLLLKEGVQEWYSALELARLAAKGKEDWDEALAAAEYANRLLVAVQKFEARL